jgi:F-type H+-transporting ATPase subunit epsilon
MILKIFLPSESNSFESVEKVSAESPEGAFTLLPNHLDFAYTLVPGLLAYTIKREGEPRYAGIDTGVLVKIGDTVLVSTQRAVIGKDLGSLRSAVEEEFLELDEREKQVQTVMLKLETDIARRIFEIDSINRP